MAQKCCIYSKNIVKSDTLMNLKIFVDCGQDSSCKFIRLYDLFYGIMLPSGNDAAFLLAEVFGLLLFYESVKP